MFGGTVLVEVDLSPIRGPGNLDGRMRCSNQDLPLIQAVALIWPALVLGFNAAVDVLCLLLNPGRARHDAAAALPAQPAGSGRGVAGGAGGHGRAAGARARPARPAGAGSAPHPSAAGLGGGRGCGLSARHRPAWTLHPLASSVLVRCPHRPVCGGAGGQRGDAARHHTGVACRRVRRAGGWHHRPRHRCVDGLPAGDPGAHPAGWAGRGRAQGDSGHHPGGLDALLPHHPGRGDGGDAAAARLCGRQHGCSGFGRMRILWRGGSASVLPLVITVLALEMGIAVRGWRRSVSFVGLSSRARPFPPGA